MKKTILTLTAIIALGAQAQASQLDRCERFYDYLISIKTEIYDHRERNGKDITNDLIEIAKLKAEALITCTSETLWDEAKMKYFGRSK